MPHGLRGRSAEWQDEQSPGTQRPRLGHPPRGAGGARQRLSYPWGYTEDFVLVRRQTTRSGKLLTFGKHKTTPRNTDL